MNRSDEYARVLLQKARDDQYVLVHLAGDAGAPPWTLGFHAQQAVEKALKAILCAQGVEYPMTHDLQRLLNLATGAGLALPPQAGQMPLLTLFGAALRYDEVPAMPGGKPFDRQWAIGLVEHVIGWAETLLG
ncbi:MAG: HEPN domain-containing protein [Planctomycetota bacterium]|nr:HEPN domain-containing protein [Planctomycetota bacterium]